MSLLWYEHFSTSGFFVSEEGEKSMSVSLKPTFSIENPCISVHLNSGSLDRLCRELKVVLKSKGIKVDYLSSELHVSIAYASGPTGATLLRHVIGEIQKKIEERGERCYVEARGFTILAGVSTPYDYLAIELEPSIWLKSAGRIARRHLRVRGFAEGFKNHVSLLRISKGALDKAEMQCLVRELNASFFAARALGSAPKWTGKCVAASETTSKKTNRICYKRRLRAA